VIALALRSAALTGVGALLIIPGTPESIAMWGVLITSVAGLLRQVIVERSARLERLDAHKFAMDDRASADAARAALQNGLAENTAITRQVSQQAAANGRKAEAAYAVSAEGLRTANNVNEKIASIAAAALSLDRGTALRDAASARADTAGIREAISHIGAA